MYNGRVRVRQKLRHRKYIEIIIRGLKGCCKAEPMQTKNVTLKDDKNKRSHVVDDCCHYRSPSDASQ